MSVQYGSHSPSSGWAGVRCRGIANAARVHSERSDLHAAISDSATAAPSIVATGLDTAFPIIFTRSSFDSSTNLPRLFLRRASSSYGVPSGPHVHLLGREELGPLQHPEEAVIDVLLGDDEGLSVVPRDRPHRVGRGLPAAVAVVGHEQGLLVPSGVAYLVVIFVLVPCVIWTGLAMSPGFTAIWPWTVTLLGGKQSARTLHFAVSVALVLFLLVHLGMLVLAGFTSRVRAMITGHLEVRR